MTLQPSWSRRTSVRGLTGVVVLCAPLVRHCGSCRRAQAMLFLHKARPPQAGLVRRAGWGRFLGKGH